MTTLRARIAYAKAQGRTVLPMSIADIEQLLAAAEGNVVPLPTRKGVRTTDDLDADVDRLWNQKRFSRPKMEVDE